MRNNNKFGAKKGGDYDSKVERFVHRKFELLQRAGLISGLRRNTHHFLLIPAITETTTEYRQLKTKVKQIVKTKVLEKAAYYTPDFIYRDTETNDIHVIEIKSWATKQRTDYIIRRKLFKWLLILHNRNFRPGISEIDTNNAFSMLKALVRVVLSSKSKRKSKWVFEKLEV